jgi:uncharacterized protein YjbI with pentapeptide repeats
MSKTIFFSTLSFLALTVLLGQVGQAAAGTCSFTFGDQKCNAPALPGRETCLWHTKEADKSGLNLMALYREQADRVLLAGAQLQNAFFDNAELTAFPCRECDLTGASFQGALLVGVTWIGTKLTGTDFTDAVFKECNLINVDMSGAMLERARFRDCVLEKVNLTGVKGREADFQGVRMVGVTARNADFSETDFTRGDLSQVDFGGAELVNADFSQSNLNEIIFSNSKLFLARFGGVRPRGIAWPSDFMVPEERNALTKRPPDLGLLERAESIYREIRLMYSGTGQSHSAGAFFYRENECKRLRSVGGERAFYELVKFGVGYGEKPWYLFRLGGIVILAGGFLFALLGVHHEGKQLWLGNQPGLWGKIVFFFTCLYFSGVTFTTLGYGDYQPRGWSRVVAVAEALLGIVTVSLFLYNFNRYLNR